LITADVEQYPAALQAVKEDLRGRSMLVKKVAIIPFECIVRGYLTGSGWKEYQKAGTVNGLPLRPGYQNASKLDTVLFTPSTKAELGEHDMPVTAAELEQALGATRLTRWPSARSGATRKRPTTRCVRHHHRGHQV
jgi:phosphoribosylaminoimidazole-succinocarboxamide synthase